MLTEKKIEYNKLVKRKLKAEEWLSESMDIPDDAFWLKAYNKYMWILERQVELIDEIDGATKENITEGFIDG